MKSTKIINLVIILLAFWVLASCGNRSRLKEQPPLALEIVEGVGFDQVFNEVIKNNCLECHSTYNQYAVAAKLAPKMLETVLTGRMPKGKPMLSTKLQGVLKSWVDSGAPEVAGGATAKAIPLEPNYESLLVNFFAPKCLACHSGSSNAPGPTDINFSTYEALVKTNELYTSRTGFPLFDTEAPEDSDFVFVITDTEEPMPPLALPGDDTYVSPGAATAEEVQALIEWMRAGLPNKR